MIKNNIYYLSINSLRKYKRLVKKYPLYFIVLAIVAIIGIPIVIELLLEYQHFFYLYFPYLVYLYGVLKYMQNNPLITIKMEVFQFKMFTLKSLKAYILFKLTFPSVLMGGAVWIIFEHIPIQVLIALMFNVILIYLCFIRYQYDQKKVFIAFVFIVVTVGLLAIYTQCYLIVIVILVMCFIHLLQIKSFNYSILYNYYKVMSMIGEGLLNKDLTKIFEAQQILNNKKVQKDHKKVINFYSNELYFFIYREYSKMTFHQKDCMNVLIGMLLLNLFYFISPIPYKYAAYSILLFLINYWLMMLTKQEIDVIKQSKIFNIGGTNYLKMKYIVNLFITLALSIVNICIIKDIFLVYLIILWILPFVNLAQSYIDNKIFKYLLTLATGIIYTLPYLYILLFV